MLWRRGSSLPEELTVQRRASLAVAEQAARFFRAPSRAGAYAAHQAGLEARRASAAAAAALAGRRDWLEISRRLAEGARELAAGVAEASRFDVGDASGLAGGAAGLRSCGRELEKALSILAREAPDEETLVAAKRWALVAQRRLRLARTAALDGPGAVRDLKVRTVL